MPPSSAPTDDSVESSVSSSEGGARASGATDDGVPKRRSLPPTSETTPHPLSSSPPSAPDATGLQAVLDGMDDGTIVLDDAQVTAVNASARRLLAPAYDVAVGHPLPPPLADALPPPGYGRRMGTALPDADLPTAPGTRIYLRHVHLADGRRLVQLRDVSDEEETREALRERNALLGGILATSITAIAVVNAQGRITYANKRAEDILGLQPGDGTWRYRSLDWSITHVDGTPARDAHLPLQRVLDTGRPVHDLQCNVTWPDGTSKRLSISAAPLAGETAAPEARVVMSVEDVTRRTRTAQRLSNEKRLSEAVINSLPGIFYMVDPEGRHHRWNRNFERLIGYSSDEIAGQALPDLFDPGDRTAVAQHVHDVLEGGDFTLEASIVTREGARIPFFFTGSRVEIDGEAYVVGMGLDMTMQKQREHELREAKEQAEAARRDAEIARQEAETMNRLKTAFLANMSHEIRTPLTAILGFADALRDDDGSNTERFAELIARGGRRLLRTLNAVLEISKLEAGSRSVSLSRLDVVREVHTVVRGLQQNADAKAVDLSIYETDHSVEANLDADALRRVVTHLVENAIQFTPDGGTVTVRVESMKSNVRIVVEDTGVGIESSFLPNLFEPFTQESTGLSRDHEGNGLGLAIAHHLVDLLNGTIAVHTTPGEGSRFSVTLPKGIG